MIKNFSFSHFPCFCPVTSFKIAQTAPNFSPKPLYSWTTTCVLRLESNVNQVFRQKKKTQTKQKKEKKIIKSIFWFCFIPESNKVWLDKI